MPPGDAERLAGAVRRVLTDVDLRARLGAAGRRRVETHFGIAAFRAAHVALYRELLASGHVPVGTREPLAAR